MPGFNERMAVYPLASVTTRMPQAMPWRPAPPWPQPQWLARPTTPQAFYPSVPTPSAYARWTPAAQTLQTPPTADAVTRRVQAEQYKNTGNEFRKLRLFPQAEKAYGDAIKTLPTYTDAYYNYAQLMSLWNRMPEAIRLMNQLLAIDPKDHDARVQLGQFLEKAGNRQGAKREYLQVLRSQPDFDPAKRRLNYLLYLDQKSAFPDTSDALFYAQRREIIHKARSLLKIFYTSYMPNPAMLKRSQSIPIVFDQTQSVDDTPNIAEYDAQRDIIRIDPQMMFSECNVVGAYLAHELVHALDRDRLSSLQEEVDGYAQLAEFWHLFKGAENDPNLDRALSLHMQSKEKLAQEVRRVYSIRNPQMPEKSPGHGLPPPNADVRDSQAAIQKVDQATLERFRSLVMAQTPGVSATTPLTLRNLR